MQQAEEDAARTNSQEIEMVAAAKESDQSSPLFRLAAYYEEQKRYKEWASVLEQLLNKELSPDKMVETKHDLVTAYYLQNDLTKVVDLAEQLIGEHPGYSDASAVFQLLGRAYGERSVWQDDPTREQRDLEKAEENLRQALELCQDQHERAKILGELGTALYNNSRLDESRQVLEQALELATGDPVDLSVSYERLGGVLISLGDVDRAIASYEQSCSANPDLPNNSTALACIKLADLYWRKGNVENSKRCLQQAERAVDRESALWASWIMGRLYTLRGDMALEEGAGRQAIENYLRALQEQNRPGEDDDLYEKLGAAFEKEGQYQQALDAYRRVLASYSSSSSPEWKDQVEGVMGRMAQVAYSMGDFQQTVILLEPIVEKLEPSSVGLGYLWLGHSYLWLKRTAKAREAYRRALKNSRFLSGNWRQAAKYLLFSARR